MKKILKSWSETDGYEYIITSDGWVGRRKIGSFGKYKKMKQKAIITDKGILYPIGKLYEK